MRGESDEAVETCGRHFVSIGVEHEVRVGEGTAEVSIWHVAQVCDAVVPAAVPGLRRTPILSAQNKVVRFGDHGGGLRARQRFLRAIVIHIEDVAD